MKLTLASRATFYSLLVLLAVIPAVSGCGRKSGPKPPEATALAEVAFPAAGASSTGITLSWQPPVNESGGAAGGLVGFRIFRGTFVKGSSTSFKPLHTVEINQEAPVAQQFSYSDTTVQPGVTYDYAIEAVNDEGTGGRVAQIVRVAFRGTSSSIEIVAPPRDADID